MMKIDPKYIKERLVLLDPGYVQLVDAPRFGALLTAMCQILSETLEDLLINTLTSGWQADPTSGKLCPMVMPAAGKALTAMERGTEIHKEAEDALVRVGRKGIEDWMVRAGHAMHSKRRMGDDDITPVDTKDVKVYFNGIDCIPASAAFVERGPMTGLHDFWTCLNQQCPKRPFVGAFEAPTCYTCGCKMAVIK